MTLGDFFPRLRELPGYEEVAARAVSGGAVEVPATAPAGRDRREARIRIAMLVELCPHGSGPCGCGSGPPRNCAHPDRPGRVYRGDCLRCKAGEVG